MGKDKNLKETLTTIGKLLRDEKYEQALKLLDGELKKSQEKEQVEEEIMYRDMRITVLTVLCKDIDKAISELALLLLSLRRAEKTKEVEDLSPYFVSFYLHVGQVRLLQNRLNAAERAFAIAVKLNKFNKNFEPLLRYAEILIKNAKTNLARKALNEILKEDPSNMKAMDLLQSIDKV